jgi:hypothetical protein
MDFTMTFSSVKLTKLQTLQNEYERPQHKLVVTHQHGFLNMQRKDHASFDDIEFFQDTRLNVIDEISFAAYHSILGKIIDHLKEFTEFQTYIYGKHAICFLGGLLST